MKSITNQPAKQLLSICAALAMVAAAADAGAAADSVRGRAQGIKSTDISQIYKNQNSNNGAQALPNYASRPDILFSAMAGKSITHESVYRFKTSADFSSPSKTIGTYGTTIRKIGARSEIHFATDGGSAILRNCTRLIESAGKDLNRCDADILITPQSPYSTSKSVFWSGQEYLASLHITTGEIVINRKILLTSATPSIVAAEGVVSIPASEVIDKANSVILGPDLLAF